jgi:hypothetical protein
MGHTLHHQGLNLDEQLIHEEHEHDLDAQRDGDGDGGRGRP